MSAPQKHQGIVLYGLLVIACFGGLIAILSVMDIRSRNEISDSAIGTMVSYDSEMRQIAGKNLLGESLAQSPAFDRLRALRSEYEAGKLPARLFLLQVDRMANYVMDSERSLGKTTGSDSNWEKINQMRKLVPVGIGTK